MAMSGGSQPHVVVPSLLFPATPIPGAFPTIPEGYPDDMPRKLRRGYGSSSTGSEDRQSTQETLSASGLTVREQSKVDAEKDEQREESQAPSCLPTAIKWVVVFFLACSFTFCLVLSKLSVIRMGKELHGIRQNKSHDSGGNATVTSAGRSLVGVESAFLLVVILLEVPYGSTLLRSIWCGAFRKDRPWPSFPALCVGVVSAVLETIGVTLFTLVVLSESAPYINVLLMNGVFLVHIIYYIIKYLRDRLNTHKCLIIIFIVALCCELMGICFTGILGKTPEFKPSKAWAIPVSLVFLSISWCPSVQKWQLYPKQCSKQTRQRKNSAPVKYSDMIRARTESRDNPAGSGLEKSEQIRQVMAGHSTSSSGAASDVSSSVADSDLTSNQPPESQPQPHTQPQPPQDMGKLVSAFPECSARWKISIITNALRIALVPAFAILFGHYLDIIYLSRLRTGLSHVTPSHPMFVPFMVNISTSFLGNLLGWAACTMCVQKAAFALPLMLATPLCLVLELTMTSCDFTVHPSSAHCTLDADSLKLPLPVAACLYLAQVLSTTYFVFTSHTVAMQKESKIFWLPGYNSVFLEQWLLLGRKTKQTDDALQDPAQRANQTRVYICTTMYREAAHEMEQLARSLAAVNAATQQSDRHFGAHVFFDNGVRDRGLTDFALQLVSVVEKSFGMSSEECTKLVTPYGLRLTWQLPALVRGKAGMDFSIHLKDNVKVKNKKRWSQVMYMSYVLDYHIREHDQATDEETYILTTDADVKFRPESVEALLDLMSRDSTVGAVCARTFPMGSGPIVWYQVFDYAIGHWFQKAANHVLGSVLCCPGCFSVYRAGALRQVLPTYASQVSHAAEFLTKDMGEDRWLCTLLVQSGWRLEYCAAADNSTYCPEDFDEFFKQRRRWIPSTLANQVLLIQEWGLVSHFNSQISWLFLVYQAALLFSSLISPSMCVLIISGGLYYAWGVSQVFSTLAILAVVIGYVVVCLSATQDTQLKAAKLLTVLFAFVMAAVVIGTATQIVEELQSDYHGNTSFTTSSPRSSTTTNATKPPLLVEMTVPYFPGMKLLQNTVTPSNPPPPLPKVVQPTSTVPPQISLPVSATTLYLGGLAGLFVLAALMHLPEAYCLLYALCYLLSLPAGYLILMVYSLCNLTDRSWGTRETKSVTSRPGTRPWYDGFVKGFKKIFPCCWKPEESETIDKCIQTSGPPSLSASAHHDRPQDGATNTQDSHTTKVTLDRSGSFRFHYERHGWDLEAIHVRDWLPKDFRDMYAGKFEAHGYDDTSLIAGMTDRELRTIGVAIKGHRRAMLEEVKTLPEPNIEPYVPDTIDEWLEAIGLLQYRDNFQTLHIVRGRHLQVLKAMTPADLARELHITKPGHFKRLLLAINRLRHPTENEREMSRIRSEIEALRTHHLEDVNRREFDFWEALRRERLQPDTAAFAHDQDLKEKLMSLRNSSLLVFGVSNLLWIILIMTLVSKTQLNVLGTNALGLCFLIIFGFVIVLQFACMLVHRVATWVHLTARAPFRCGAPYNSSWAFNDNNLENSLHHSVDLAGDSTDVEALRQKHLITDEMRRSYRERIRSRYPPTGPSHRPGPMATVQETSDERQPLISRKKRSVNAVSSPEEDNA